MINIRRIRDDVLALALLAAAGFVALSLISYSPADPPSQLIWPATKNIRNVCGEIGAQVAFYLNQYCGLGAWFVLACMLTSDARLFSKEGVSGWISRLVGVALALVAVCVLLQLFVPNWSLGPLVGSGGKFGAWGQILLTGQFNMIGVSILLGCTLLAGMLLTGDLAIIRNVLFALTAPLRLLRWLNPFRRRKPDANDEDEKKSSWELDRIPVSQPPILQSSMAQNAAEDGPRSEPPVVRPPVPINPPPTFEIADGWNVNASARPEFQLKSEMNFEVEPEPDPEPESIPLAVEEPKPRQPIRINRPRTAPAAVAPKPKPKPVVQTIELPTTDLLEQPEAFPYELLASKAQVAAQTLEQCFQEFGLNIQVVEIDTGPVVTQFELQLEPGLRLSRVTALADDIAIALRVPSVRVVAPIPGKNTVGVEVPNEKQVMVRLRELIECCEKERGSHRVPVYLGKDVSGHPMTVDLTKLPHLLIAGRTGTGKSVCLNTLIISMLMTRTPEDVKLLMIDPKMVELSPYKRVPHLMHPVITDMKKAEAMLAWAVDKMEERYDLLARTGVRHLDSYNKLGKDEILDRMGLDPDDPEDMLECEEIPDRMPYIVIIADEMADMIMTSGKDVEGHIIRLAQKSRAVGIHLVLATQKPTVDVLTGLIKSNLPARISFQVASRTDSRVVLDEMGAERLLGNGDMLFLAPGTSTVTRAQGAFVSDEEVNAVIDFYSQYEPQYSQELAQLKAPTGDKSGTPTGTDDRDELYEEAVEVVIREQLGSVSRLQRFLGIGYGRAARLVDYMAEDGIVGDYNGSKAREVLYTMEEWEALKADREGVPA
ncbi:DNA translocase FtsK [Thalassoroseus pseudoceratinae]|uniref:DNA translocase FtsK n=1 Tax=Thalassoroseus pseudoceratinae TaxID=2713176 RepID=UPI0014202162|nr:DNA translocase FtsK [Thalassoroseus pseudoceratinae]